MKIIFATTNNGKMKEVREILGDLNMEVFSLEEVGISIEIEENGTTFEENALIKARTISKLCPGELVLADDSGLEVDRLDKEPGIHSARYLGEDTAYEEKNRAILERLEGVETKDRTARFVCAIAAILPNGKEMVCRATLEGRIAESAAGKNGFGYDPIFWVPGCNCTSAELTIEEKNKRSHRGQALRLMRDNIRGCIDAIPNCK